MGLPVISALPDGVYVRVSCFLKASIFLIPDIAMISDIIHHMYLNFYVAIWAYTSNGLQGPLSGPQADPAFGVEGPVLGWF